jgi:hypothetical protein
MLRFILWFALFALVVAALLSWRRLRPIWLARRVERARNEFTRHRQSLESQFFAMASASGKPRGLTWKSCAFQNGIVVARDRATGELVGLVGVTIGFDAVQGGGMEDVEAVGNLRAATAVFTHNGRLWTTAGRVLFNLEPQEVLQRYGNILDPCE